MAELDHNKALELLWPFHDLIAAAPRQDRAPKAADDLRHSVGVLLVHRRIGNPRAGKPICGHNQLLLRRSLFPEFQAPSLERHYRRRVAANGAAPPGAEAAPVTSALCRAPGGAVRGQAPPASVQHASTGAALPWRIPASPIWRPRSAR